jgi:hypothetical protein
MFVAFTVHLAVRSLPPVPTVTQSESFVATLNSRGNFSTASAWPHKSSESGPETLKIYEWRNEDSKAYSGVFLAIRQWMLRDAGREGDRLVFAVILRSRLSLSKFVFGTNVTIMLRLTSSADGTSDYRSFSRSQFGATLLVNPPMGAMAGSPSVRRDGESTLGNAGLRPAAPRLLQSGRSHRDRALTLRLGRFSA